MLFRTHPWFIGSSISIHASNLNHQHKIFEICGWHMYVAIAYWLSRNTFRYGKRKLGNVSQNLKLLMDELVVMDFSTLGLLYTRGERPWRAKFHPMGRLKNQEDQGIHVTSYPKFLVQGTARRENDMESTFILYMTAKVHNFWVQRIFVKPTFKRPN